MKPKTILLLASLAMFASHTASAAILTVTTTADSRLGSLRDALASAANGDTIDASGVSGTILLTSGELLVTNSLIIIGPGPNNLAVDGNAASRVFHVVRSNIVTITGLNITNGHVAVGFGGGIYNAGTLTVTNCVLSGNSVGTNGSPYVADGGGIYNEFGTLTIQSSTLSGNSAKTSGSSGGGIFNWQGALTVQSSTLSNNSAGSVGGGIRNLGGDGSSSIENCTLSGNSATSESGRGGGIFHNGGRLTITSSALTGNSAGGTGGGIVSYSELTLRNSTLIGNSAGLFGGGIAIGGTLTIESSTVSSNSVSGTNYGGGGIFSEGAITVINSTISDNSAPGGRGGGILNFNSADGDLVFIAMLSLESCTVSGNNAFSGGGIANVLEEVSGIPTSIPTPGFQITNSIVALNTVGANPDIVGLFTGNFNFIGGDPLLGPLADNGGPTPTMALLPGSPCINAGDPGFVGPPIFDQRGQGFPRVVDGLVDIGAFEVQPPADSDGDGVLDTIDQCSDTPPGDIVNATGCSIAQLVPCAGPRSGGTWKNHGHYVREVVRTATDFLKAKLITRKQWAQIVTTAARSKCGWNRRSDHDGDRDWHREWNCERDGDWGRERDRDGKTERERGGDRERGRD